MANFSLYEIKTEAKNQLDEIVPGKVKVTLEKNQETGRNELVGYYEQHGDQYMKSESFTNGLFNIGLTLFVSYFAKRKEYIMASPQMQQLAFDNSIHPQAYPEFAKSLAKELFNC